MKVQIEFDLQNDSTIVHWPWGGQGFPFTPEGAKDMSEALKNAAIELSRRGLGLGRATTSFLSHAELAAIRTAIDGGKVKRYEEGSSGLEKKLTLAELFDEVE